MSKVTYEQLKDAYTYHLGDAILKLNSEEEFNNKKEFKNLLRAIGFKNIFIEYEKFKKLRKIYDLYLDLLTDFLLKHDSKINKILVFESPRDKHFLEEQHKKNDKSNYYRIFRDHENEKRLGNYQLLEKQSVLDKIKIYNQFKIFFDQQNSENEFVNNILNIIHSEIVFIDLIIIPKNLKEKREKWCVDDQYIFDVDGEKKRLTVCLLDFALDHLNKKIEEKVEKIKEVEEKEKKKNPFAENCQIAIGTPLNTSVSIFEYYVDKYLVLPGGKIAVDISRLNSPTAFKKTTSADKTTSTEGTIFPLFKANVIGSGNFPTRTLVKNAFNIH
jgi:hypothetical protein